MSIAKLLAPVFEQTYIFPLQQTIILHKSSIVKRSISIQSLPQFYIKYNKLLNKGDLMDLEPIWETFITRLTLHPFIESVYRKKITGIPFLYISLKQPLVQVDIEKEISKCSIIAVKGKRLHSETIFVRNEGMMYVYRHRFLVPQEKMFCCGNLCKDCTRTLLKKPAKN
jgi:hypothetical protein